MRGFWAGIWRSPGLCVLAGAVISAVLASVLYAFNWHTFYDTQRNRAVMDARDVAADISGLATVAADAGTSNELPHALTGYLGRRRARIEVRLQRDDRVVWQVDNHADLDLKRTQLQKSFELPAPNGGVLVVAFREGIRPPFHTALIRAWTFSLADYRRDPDAWHREHLYNRSLPLYGYLLTVVVVGFGTIRALHRDQVELMRLDVDAHEVATELLGLRERNRAETEALRGHVARTELQREEAVRARDRLSAEIAAVGREYDAIAQGDSPDEVSDERLRSIKAKKSQIERELAIHDAIVDRYEHDLGDTRAELAAAEELLGEVEVRHADLEDKLRDRNREIRQLKGLVEAARRDTNQIHRTTDQQAEKNARLQNRTSGLETRLEEQLDSLLDAPGEANVNFSAHSRTGPIQALFEKLDRRFVDRFFSHVTNPEYERGARRIIRVQGGPTEEPASGARFGEIIIVLDDDAGRTLGLRYDLRPGATDASHVGFVLALLLRARTRELVDFPIRVR